MFLLTAITFNKLKKILSALIDFTGGSKKLNMKVFNE